MTLMDAEAAREILAAADVKLTAQRIDIARILFARPQHMTADQLLNSLQLIGQDCSRATVYNTLGLFQRCGLVREVVVEPGRVFFDSVPGPHHHFFNLDTGEIRDIEVESARLASIPELPEGTRLEGVDVVLRIRQA